MRRTAWGRFGTAGACASEKGRVAPPVDRKDSLDLFFGGSLRWRERLGFRLTEKLDEDLVDVVDG